jgi:hypothetical protein
MGGDTTGGEGVLAKAGPWMATAIGLVAVSAMAEAGWNLGKFVLDILRLPLPLAVMFPVIMESASGTFAIQDLRDRRAGYNSTAMRAATYLTLAASSAINGIVGATTHGRAGLLEVFPPLVLAAVIHLHGDRATRAWHSRAVLRPEWRAARLREDQVTSTVEVLPLLAGDDEHGLATVALLRRRLESCTLEPGEALMAAGWGQRAARVTSPSMLRRLETVAATVWGPDRRDETPATPMVEVADLVESGKDQPRDAAARPAKTARKTVPSDGGKTVATDEEILQIFRDAGVDGRPAAHKALREAGVSCGGPRLQRLVREHKDAAGPRLRAVNED